MRSLRSIPTSGLLAATLVAVIAGVHFQQYVDFMSQVPKVGVLFLLNAAGGAGLVFALISRQRPLRILAALGAIGLALGSLISIGIALSGNFLGYSEPTLRLPIVIAIVAEALALPLLARLALHERRALSAAQQPQA
ncbi:MAG TPA: hypothetical protein VFP55_08430 [Solirubrobacteraceae bacterium]|nr:hypothetical protein [Solirubrobacteraceae bacterium]